MIRVSSRAPVPSSQDLGQDPCDFVAQHLLSLHGLQLAAFLGLLRLTGVRLDRDPGQCRAGGASDERVDQLDETLVTRGVWSPLGRDDGRQPVPLRPLPTCPVLRPLLLEVGAACGHPARDPRQGFGEVAAERPKQLPHLDR
jgi:hypothetical protein